MKLLMTTLMTLLFSLSAMSFDETRTLVDSTRGYSVAMMSGAEAEVFYQAMRDDLKSSHDNANFEKRYNNEYLSLSCLNYAKYYNCLVTLEHKKVPDFADFTVDSISLRLSILGEEALKMKTAIFGPKGFSFESGNDLLYFESMSTDLTDQIFHALNIYIYNEQ